MPSGISVGLVNQNVLSKSLASSANIPAFDVMPGGFINGDAAVPADINENVGVFTWANPTGLNLTANWFNPQPQTFCPNAPVATIAAGAVFLNYNLNATSQGFNFCFVPIQSALDYRGPVPQDHNIYNDPVGVTMQRTPFDVIIGEINGQPGYPQPKTESGMTLNNFAFPSRNLGHVKVNNHQLRDNDSLMQNFWLPPNNGNWGNLNNTFRALPES